MTTPESRRPIEARNTRWATVIARWLAGKGIRPNTISVASVFFAALAGAALFAVGRVDSVAIQIGLCIAGAVGIQLRLLCNLFDGMVAIEQGMKTPSGAIFNELPDRFADAFILIGAGYANAIVPWSDEVGWAVAVLAMITAYVRALGASAGSRQHFLGPMAKQHRMALMTLACIVSAICLGFGVTWPILSGTLAVIVAGCLLTIVRRCRAIIADLNELAEGTP